MASIRSFLRGAMSCALFIAFGLGALALSPLMLLLGNVERCQPVVRVVWMPLVWLFVRTGLIRIDRGNLPDCRGTILVANHPSLIDVVLLTVLMPKTLSVTKPSVGRNPVIGVMARTVAIPLDATKFNQLATHLSRGWNILVFPEGTRSPFPETAADRPELHPFRRGVAQLALRTGAPVVCIGIRQSRRILAKRQPAWDMGSARVVYRFRSDEPTVERPQAGESLHVAAAHLTAELERRIGELIAR